MLRNCTPQKRPSIYISRLFSPSFYLFPRAWSSSELIHPLQTEASMSSRSGRLRSGSLPTLPTRLLFPSEPSTTNSNSIRWDRMRGKIESDGLQLRRASRTGADARAGIFVLGGFPQVHQNPFVHTLYENGIVVCFALIVKFLLCFIAITCITFLSHSYSGL